MTLNHGASLGFTQMMPTVDGGDFDAAGAHPDASIHVDGKTTDVISAEPHPRTENLNAHRNSTRPSSSPPRPADPRSRSRSCIRSVSDPEIGIAGSCAGAYSLVGSQPTTDWVIVFFRLSDSRSRLPLFEPHVGVEATEPLPAEAERLPAADDAGALIEASNDRDHCS